MSASRLLPALPLLLVAAPARADHGGLLDSVPTSAMSAALLAGGSAFVTLLLPVVIVRLLALPARGPE